MNQCYETTSLDSLLTLGLARAVRLGLSRRLRARLAESFGGHLANRSTNPPSCEIGSHIRRHDPPPQDQLDGEHGEASDFHDNIAAGLLLLSIGHGPRRDSSSTSCLALEYRTNSAPVCLVPGGVCGAQGTGQAQHCKPATARLAHENHPLKPGVVSFRIYGTP